MNSSVLAPAAAPPAASQARSSVESVYEEHFAFVWRCLRSLGVATVSLDDATHDVFVVVQRQLSSFAGRSSLRTWLYGIARKIASKHRQRQKRAGSAEALSDDAPSALRDPEQASEDLEAARFVCSFAAGLSDARRDVFILAELEQWSAPEVAEALEVPLNTVYSRLRAARLEFQQALTRLEEEHGK